MKNFNIYISLFLLVTSIISAQSFDRNILLEVFTNSHCGVCPATHTTIDSYLANGNLRDNVNYIFYHMEFPYSDDKLYIANKNDAAARNNFYGPFFSTPITFFDGEKKVNSYNQWSSLIESRLNKKTPIGLMLSGEKDGSNFTIAATIQQETNLISDNIVAHFVVVENIEYSGRNGISFHKNVMRKMITGSEGIQLEKTATLNFTQLVSTNSDWILDNVGVLVFVQNPINKEVFQSDYISYSSLTVTDVEEKVNLPSSFNLKQNYPNPFNPSTAISYQLAENSKVELIVYDLLGKEIAALVNQQQQAGSYSVNFNAKGLTSGIYIYKLTANNNVSIKKMVLLR